MKSLDDIQLKDSSEAAEYMGTTAKRLNDLWRKDDGPAYITFKGGKKRYTRVEWIEEYLNRRRVNPNAGSARNAETNEGAGKVEFVLDRGVRPNLPHRFIPRIGRGGQIDKGNGYRSGGKGRKGVNA